MATTKIVLARVYRELFNLKWRHIIFHGGRGSGKSTAVGYALLLRGRKGKLRILCTRELQNSIADSVHKLLKDLIEKHGFTDYVVQNDTIRNTITGTEIIFKGLRKDGQAIKSMEGIDICWVEEAQTVSEASIKDLIPTIRKAGSQIIWTFNRLLELDPVYVKLCMKPGKKTYIAHVNSDVLESIGQLPQTLIDEREESKENDSPDLYAHIWLGEPMGQGDNAIIPRALAMEAMNREVESDGAVIIGADIARMGGDRIVFWARKGLKTIKTATYTKKRTNQTCDLLEQFVSEVIRSLPIIKELTEKQIVELIKKTEIRIDDTGVGGGVTDDMMNRDYKEIKAVNFGAKAIDGDKYPNWISEAWFHLADVIREIEIPMDSDLLMELTTRQWKMDSKGKRRVESKDDYKKRGFRSPDLADGAIICYAEQVDDRRVQFFSL
jgi:phage terminase large subunit